MQLNHVDGKVLIIDEKSINIQLNKLKYTIYEFGDKKVILENNTNYTFKNFDIGAALKTNVNILEECYYNLISEKFQDWSLSTDEKNWIIETGSTGQPTTVRVYIPASVLNKNFNKKNSLDVLMKSMENISDFAVRNGKGSMQYLEELLPQHKAILEQYPDISIEYKDK